MASCLKGLAAEKIPYYYGYMVKLITITNIQYGYEGHNRMEERTSQWGGFPLFFVPSKIVSCKKKQGCM